MLQLLKSSDGDDHKNKSNFLVGCRGGSGGLSLSVIWGVTARSDSDNGTDGDNGSWGDTDTDTDTDTGTDSDTVCPYGDLTCTKLS